MAGLGGTAGVDGARRRPHQGRLAAAHGEAAAWRGELLAAFDEGEPADGERALDLAEEHRLHIARWFTTCPPDMHRRIADDFAADPRAFALVVPPSQQRPGLAAYLCKAVHANAGRRADREEDG